jgi:hypothetical protein
MKTQLTVHGIDGHQWQKHNYIVVAGNLMIIRNVLTQTEIIVGEVHWYDHLRKLRQDIWRELQNQFHYWFSRLEK